jgi:hypothetical protein
MDKIEWLIYMYRHAIHLTLMFLCWTSNSTLFNNSQTQPRVQQEEHKLQDIYIQRWIRLTSKYMT